jgi:ADP-ribose pyrophosphatase YjhB (NUDIX family)
MSPRDFFHHCPRCGVRQAAPPAANVLDCAACGFRLFFNAACAVVAFIRDDAGRWLFIRRAREPAAGKLAPPGGFIDIGERAEEALHREIREEVGLALTDVAFLSSEVNHYLHRDVTYPVLDLCFTARAAEPSAARALDEVAGLAWLTPGEVAPDELAFSSMRAAWARLVLSPERSPKSQVSSPEPPDVPMT